MRPKLKPFASVLIFLLSGLLAAGNYYAFVYAPFGKCTFGEIPLDGDMAQLTQGLAMLSACINYGYYFVGSPLVIGLLLLLIVPRLVTSDATGSEEQQVPVQPVVKKAAPPPPPPKPTTDAAVQLLGLLQREGRLVDFLREDIQSYEDEQVGAAVRAIHESCRQVLSEHLTLEPVLSGNEGDDVTVPKDFDPSAIRLTGNVSGEPPFRGTLRHSGWRATQVKLPSQPSGQDPKIVAPAEVEIS
ncbi:MAG: DUF2760 domain-containing protein [Deltaproteobacteria bacterium]|nr:DUF2760 domain-containing protein [Deltaproteobacteria bacterium]